MNKSKWLHSLHEGHESGLSYYKDKPSWIVFTEEVGHDPNDMSGKDFREWSDKGFWPICRINNGYRDGSNRPGTIPLPQDYDDFSKRVQNYVRASTGCVYWLVGNEVNLDNERPNGQIISPESYVDCFKLCRFRIKVIAGHAGDIVIPAPIAPWNIDSGDWIGYFKQVMQLLEPDGCDGIALHTYTHGSDPSLIFSEAKMNPPYQDRYYNFKAYQDFMEAIPLSMRSLPVLITESDQNDPWDNSKPNSWIQSAYGQIEQWNALPSNQTIQCLTMYRFPNHDKWYMIGKDNVLADFSRSVDSGFRSPEPRSFMPESPILKGAVTAILLNVRDKPDVTGKLVGSRAKDNTVDILETSSDGSWYRIGQDQWVSSAWVNAVQLVGTDNWSRILNFLHTWEGGFQDLDWDAGNWTGCKVGVGEKKGTNHGISACTYPNLDIKNLTWQQAEEIYHRDMYLALGIDKQPWPMALLMMNAAVNFPSSNATAWLQQSGGDPLLFYALMLRGYRNSAAWPQASNAWVDRMIDLVIKSKQ